MRHALSSPILTLLLAAPAAAACPSATPAQRVLASTAWQTTAVYEGDDRSKNVIDRYPAVVGLSVWDACSNRFEYFDPASGASRARQGGAGYYLFTGDGRDQVTLPDRGRPISRQLQILDAHEFTYSRSVPRNLQAGQPQVTLHVVHTPYRGPLPLAAQPGSAPR